jgi:hypothetical protein
MLLKKKSIGKTVPFKEGLVGDGVTNALAGAGFVLSSGVHAYKDLRQYQTTSSENRLTFYQNLSTDLAKDAASGAAGMTIGAAVGSVIPGAGTLVGGAVGFIVGVGASYLAKKWIGMGTDFIVKKAGNIFGGWL